MGLELSILRLATIRSSQQRISHSPIGLGSPNQQRWSATRLLCRGKPGGNDSLSLSARASASVDSDLVKLTVVKAFRPAGSYKSLETSANISIVEAEHFSDNAECHPLPRVNSESDLDVQGLEPSVGRKLVD